jgi:hypothetical protein
LAYFRHFTPLFICKLYHIFPAKIQKNPANTGVFLYIKNAFL